MVNRMREHTGKPHSPWGKLHKIVEPHVETLLALYTEGLSMRQVAEQLGIGVSGVVLRDYMLRTHNEAFEAALINRAHEMVERNAEDASRASANGDSSGLKTAIDTRFKLAGLYAPDLYGDKRRLELTGKDGGSIRLEALTDDALAKIASQGAAE